MRFFCEWMLAMGVSRDAGTESGGALGGRTRRVSRAGQRRTIAALSAPTEAFAEEPPAPAPPGGGDIARNTAIFSIATGISRIAGLAREIVAASFFGTRGPASAFTLAFQIPNLVSNLFANAALSAAFVPVFTDLLQQGRRKEAFRLASTLFWIILIVLGAVTAFFMLAAGVIMPLFTGSTFTAA